MHSRAPDAFFSDLWTELEAHWDDPFAPFHIAKSRAFSEEGAYERLAPLLPLAVVDRLEHTLPWLFRVPVRTAAVEVIHCRCPIPDVRWTPTQEAVCCICGVSRAYLLTQKEEDLPYGSWVERPRVYTRANRFRTVLHRFLDGCCYRAPPQELEQVMAELRRRRIHLRPTATDVRRALRKLKMGALYTSAPGIVGQIRGRAAPLVSTEDTMRIRRIFDAVDGAMRFSGRKYMPSYMTILTGILLHIGWSGDDAETYVPGLTHKKTRGRVQALCDEAMARVKQS